MPPMWFSGSASSGRTAPERTLVTINHNSSQRHRRRTTLTNIERIPSRSIYRSRQKNNLAARLQAARTGQALASVEHHTVVRVAEVQSEGIVTGEKLREVDRLAYVAMSGQAMLRGWANHLAADDPILTDEMRFFSDVAKLGKGEVIADAINRFRGL